MATKSVINIGFKAIDIDIECSLSNGLPSVTIVGLASKAVDEAKERLRIAISSSGFSFPRKRIVINLAPADIPKDTASLDVAMAMAILQADGQISAEISDSVFIGELGLDGAMRPVRGILGKLRDSYCSTADKVFIPTANDEQAAITDAKNIYAVSSLKQLVGYLNGQVSIAPLETGTYQSESATAAAEQIDFAEINGQETAKRALIVAAAGGHNVLLSGPPGTGKSMLAKAFIGILPPLTNQQAIETTHLHSLSGVHFSGIVTSPPLRSPHHTASDVAIIGGGHTLRPGEISLAHNGVLFLDELPEFSRSSIESLRQPLEDGVITIARAQQSAQLPARFMLIATSNPCPCGYLYSEHSCTCTPAQIQRYQKKLSGPIIDRIDIHVTVGSVDHRRLLSEGQKPQNHQLQDIVVQSRAAQYGRQRNKLNSQLTNRDLKHSANLSSGAEALLNNAAASLQLSPRSYIRTLKVARTIADIEASDRIENGHVAEALQYRPRQQTY